MKVHLQLDGSLPRAAEHARELAALGADGAFTFEGPHDVFLPLSVAAGTTSLELMTNVAIAGPRSPVHLAHSAYDLQAYSEGRFRLGLGTQIKVHIEKRYGAVWHPPARFLGETVRAVQAVFAAWEGAQPLDFRGTFHTHTLMPPNFDPGPNPFGPPPVLMGGLGPIMTRTAAEVADGLLVMPFNTVRHLTDRTLPAIDEGLRRCGRTRAQFPIIGQAMVAVGRDEAELRAAIDGVAVLIAFYGSTPAYRPVLDAEGWGDLHPVLNRLSKTGGYAAMRALITDEMVARIGVVGSPADCAAEIGRRFGDFADEVCCYFPAYQPAPDAVAALLATLHRSPS
ncbi:TIGR03617 family F420-dependent LLM class oxidoreductase [Gordonia alkaliphila]|uniref:TIGR03617 family F420-dependent LLM class oxidoreductase n=1 Tax=Gordonia alkaliphila TaxID=1053547 RepID=UPI001FF3DF0B|nr:TIGR03617 family F420-dependent LLM class oxidoreductase [Gordonia alkaliphila]MCK0440465.1 TIGR03617 family F420-dependent LLM class oxidoreductase [Gordonia alkaliphila]